MNKIAFFGLAALMSVTGQATEYFVDCTRPDDSGDGLTVEMAKRTIKGALTIKDLPAESVITVLPGVYDEGETYDYSLGVNSRVYVNKKLTIRSRDGAEKTIIMGAKDPDGNNGMTTSPGAASPSVRPVSFAVAGKGAVVQGFTLTGGSTVYIKDQSNERFTGGGVGAMNDCSRDVYVVDCVISNNVAMRGGAAARVTLVRTKVLENEAANSAATYNCNAAHCLIAGNYGGGHAVQGGNAIVNCTIVDNCNRAMGNDASVFDNCVFLMNTSEDIGATTVAYNCLAGKTDTGCDAGCVKASNIYQFLAPAYGDYRLLSTSEGVDIGKTDRFADLVIPDEYLWKDLAMNDVAKSGSVQPGCYQQLAVAKSGCVKFEGARHLFNGRARMVGNQYVHSENWPEQVLTQPILDEGEHFFAYSVVERLSLDRYRTVQKDGSLWLALPPKGTTITLRPQYAQHAFWVDDDAPDYEGDDKGCEAHPFRTLQEAADACHASENNIIYVAEGTYDQGGASMEGCSNRVAVSRGPTRILATGAPEKTFIVGAPDPATQNGLGSAATRCVGIKTYCFVQGFTLTGGHDSGQDAYPGAAVWVKGDGYIKTTRVLDCIVTNNTSSKGVVQNTTVMRCRFADNSGFAVMSSRVSSSFFGPSSKTGYPISTGVSAFNCTVAAGKSGQNAFRYDSSHYGSVFYGCKANPTYYGTLNFAGCMAWDCTGFPDSAGLAVQDPCLVNAAAEDFRLMSFSPAVCCYSGDYPDEWWLWASCDLDGKPLVCRDGKVTPGAWQTMPMAVVVSGRGVAPVGTNVVEKGESLVVTATNADRKLEGFLVNGVLEPPAAGTRSWSVTNLLDVASGFLAVSAKYVPTGLMLIFR